MLSLIDWSSEGRSFVMRSLNPCPENLSQNVVDYPNLLWGGGGGESTTRNQNRLSLSQTDSFWGGGGGGGVNLLNAIGR